MFRFHRAPLGFHTLQYRPGAQEHAGNDAGDADVANADGHVDVAGDARATAAVAHTAVFLEGSRRCYTPDAAYVAEGDGAVGRARMTLRELRLAAVS